MYTHGCIQHRQCNEKKSSPAKAHMGHRITKETHRSAELLRNTAVAAHPAIPKTRLFSQKGEPTPFYFREATKKQWYGMHKQPVARGKKGKKKKGGLRVMIQLQFTQVGTSDNAHGCHHCYGMRCFLVQNQLTREQLFFFIPAPYPTCVGQYNAVLCDETLKSKKKKNHTVKQ